MAAATHANEPLATKGNQMRGNVSVIIVNWNVRHHLQRCLQSLQDATSVLGEIIVVDNGSHDGSVQMVKDAFQQVRLISNDANKGFAQAANQGLSSATGDWLLLLNPDTEVKPKAVEALLTCLADCPSVAAAGPRICTPAGDVDFLGARRFPTPWSQALDWAGVTHRWPRLAAHLLPTWDHRSSREVECLSGACVMLRRQALESVGSFDPGYFLYGEDVDLFLRLAQAGWKLVYCAMAEVIHHGGQSSEQVPVEAGLASLRSHQRFFRKHYGTGSIWLFRLLILVITLSKGAVFSGQQWTTRNTQRRQQQQESARAHFRYAAWAFTTGAHPIVAIP